MRGALSIVAIAVSLASVIGYTFHGSSVSSKGSFISSEGRLSQPRISHRNAADLEMGLIDRFKKVGSRLRKPRNRVTVIPRLEKSPPLNIAMFIEPTPFTHVSGYSNRFKEALKYLAKAGDNVEILTTDDVPDAPESFLGFPINYTKGFRFPLYNQIVLSADHEGKGKEMLGRRRPDLLHVTCPGFITLAALVYARMFKLPLVFSYHTHLPHYAIQYLGWVPGIEDAAWTALRFVLNRADLTLVTSGPMRDQLARARRAPPGGVAQGHRHRCVQPGLQVRGDARPADGRPPRGPAAHLRGPPRGREEPQAHQGRAGEAAARHAAGFRGQGARARGAGGALRGHAHQVHGPHAGRGAERGLRQRGRLRHALGVRDAGLRGAGGDGLRRARGGRPRGGHPRPHPRRRGLLPGGPRGRGRVHGEGRGPAGRSGAPGGDGRGGARGGRAVGLGERHRRAAQRAVRQGPAQLQVARVRRPGPAPVALRLPRPHGPRRRGGWPGEAGAARAGAAAAHALPPAAGPVAVARQAAAGARGQGPGAAGAGDHGEEAHGGPPRGAGLCACGGVGFFPRRRRHHQLPPLVEDGLPPPPTTTPPLSRGRAAAAARRQLFP
ncbi:unnamed protein product [Heterosigma akashiwo]